MKWIKASERLPDRWPGITVRQISTKVTLSHSMAKDWISDDGGTDVEWLDESPSAQVDQEGQDALWDEAIDLISRMPAKSFHPVGIVSILQPRYTITKK